MGQDPQRDLKSGDFKPDSFQYTVLKLRETCAQGQASPAQIVDWETLSGWLGCGDGPVTAEHGARLKSARIAFLHSADGSAFDASQLPPPAVSDIFERLSPAGAAIARLKSRRGDAAKPRAAGIGRQFGSLAGGIIAFGAVLAIYFARGVPSDPNLAAGVEGKAFVPGAVAMAVAAVWRGGPKFRPLKDSAIIAIITGFLVAMSAPRQAGGSINEAAMVLVQLIAFVVVSALVWCLTAGVTWGLNVLVARLKSAKSAALGA